VTTVSVLMGIIVFVLAWLLGLVFGSGKGASLLILIIGGLVGALFYALITRIMRMEEFEMTMDMLRRNKK
jgi:putative peptidoglycan lipid II flippase